LTVAVHDFDAIRREIGLAPQTPILEQLEGLTEAEAMDKRRQLDIIEAEIAQDARAQDGARALLQGLASRGAALGVLTRNSKKNAHVTLEVAALDGYFEDRFIISRDCAEPKPSPDGVHALLDRWDADAADAVIVGDFLFDLQAGRRAGAATVYFDAAHSGQWANEADISVHSFDELAALALSPQA